MTLATELPIHLQDWCNVFHYISAYGAYVALWAVLSAMTVYRREISCNRSYHKDDDIDNEMNDTRGDNLSAGTPEVKSSRYNDETELLAEELLEGAGLYCSGRPLLAFAELLWLGLEGYDKGNNDSKGNDFTPEDLLDRVGNYTSPEPVLATMIEFLMIWKKGDVTEVVNPLFSSLSRSSLFDKNYGSDPLMRGMPPDVHVHIAAFLHPRDIVTLANVSKAYHNIIDDSNNMTSAAIWKTLWYRDYAWVVLKWRIGKRAFDRSNFTQWSYSKDFYFIFGQAYLDYVLAGHNTFDSCLVGIHSNIYDITPFLFSHPGSPDTLMVHSGRDATRLFDDMGHSTGARKLAMSMCVVVDRSAQNEQNDCGLFPTNHTDVNEDMDCPLPPRLPDGEDNLLKMRRRRAIPKTGKNLVLRGSGTLQKLRARFLEKKEQVRNENMRIYAHDRTILGNIVNPYFDPFRREWRIWYTNTDLETVFLPAS